MLESMIHNATPTRAEITDVANAVFDGTSAIMLSGETAMGDHPARVVKVMSKIATQAENDAFEMNAYSGIKHDTETADTANAICDAACTTARDVNAKAIIAVTKTGHTARRMSKFRPSTPIVAATPSVKTYNQLALSWGVYPVLALSQPDFDRLLQHAIDCAKQIDLVSIGDQVVIVGGLPLDSPGNTNIIKIEQIS
jgi:pyruvate kinase